MLSLAERKKIAMLEHSSKKTCPTYQMTKLAIVLLLCRPTLLVRGILVSMVQILILPRGRRKKVKIERPQRS